MKIEIDLTIQQTALLKTFIRRQCWEDARLRTETDDEAYEVLEIMNQINKAILEKEK